MRIRSLHRDRTAPTTYPKRSWPHPRTAAQCPTAFSAARYSDGQSDNRASPARLRQRRLRERPGLRLWLRLWFRRRQWPRLRLGFRRDRRLWLWFRRPRRWWLQARRPRQRRPVRLARFLPRSLRSRQRAADVAIGRLGLVGRISRHLAMISAGPPCPPSGGHQPRDQLRDLPGHRGSGLPEPGLPGRRHPTANGGRLHGGVPEGAPSGAVLVAAAQPR